ncbi:MAG: Asp-tRNA(Asn)/Glu-tRNA(Gln) amidotransferase subunit GatA [Candidatus Spechtbacterales bacterium]
MDSTSYTLAEIIKRTRAKELSFTELTDEYLARIDKRNGELHAFLSVDAEGARNAASAADVAFNAEEASPLFGVPVAVKDAILVDGAPCTAGSKMLEHYIAPYDATVMVNLKRVGAFSLGKTNMDEFAMGSSTEHSAFGPTKNPHDPTRVPGGSSGGSAAAVAAGLAPLALGSDTGGSIRQPAAFCGVVGFKPTYGAISRFGLIAMASSLDQIGTFTRTVEDVKLVAPYLFGRDDNDATTQDIPELAELPDPKSITIGILKEGFGEGVHEGMKTNLLSAIAAYEKMGVTIKEISIPHLKYSLPVYYIIMPSEVSSNMTRYDGIRYGLDGPGQQEDNLLGYYLHNRREGIGEEVRRRIMLGTYTLSAGYYDAYYARAQKVRTLIKQDFENAFNEVDIIAAPTTPTPPFKFGEKMDDPLEMYLSDVYTVSANLAGVPAISIPAGTVEEGGMALPVGLQLIGPHKQDYRLLEVASWLERTQGPNPKS